MNTGGQLFLLALIGAGVLLVRAGARRGLTTEDFAILACLASIVLGLIGAMIRLFGDPVYSPYGHGPPDVR